MMTTADKENTRKKLRVLSDRLDGTYTHIDQVYAKIAAQENLSCGKRTPCNGCCYQLVQVSISEAARIIEKHPMKMRTLRRKILEAADTISELAHQLEISSSYTVDSGDLQPSMVGFAEEYWKKQIPCVFLNEEGKCQVYEDRPIACRTYVTVSDPELCHKTDATEEIASPGAHDMVAALRVDIALREQSIVGPKTTVIGPLPSVIATLFRYIKV